MWRHAKARAVKKSLAFDISVQDIARELQRGTCAVTGLKFVMESKHPRSPSLDRIVPALGYVPGNCRLVLFAINTAMNDWGLNALMEIIREWKP